MSFVKNSDCAVYVRGLVKQFGGGPPTLNNLNMTVNKGTIYGMLGASGCGKTTLLSCLVGLQTWSAGEVNVLGHSPGKQLSQKMGYMPQDLALYEQLDAYEILQFYGKLYHIPEYQLKERWSSLKALLEFPDKLTLIRNMSGGQSRRASLALALLHSPELLILDEPTVGLDPLLREKIWNYLQTIVETMNTTILITTHYMEEARSCSMIGVMRNGRIITESSPARLLETFNCYLLDDAVAKLCQDDEKQFAVHVSKNPGRRNNKALMGFATRNSIQSPETIKNSRLLRVRKFLSIDCEKIENEETDNARSMGSIFGSGNTDMGQSFENIHGFTKVMTLTLLRHPVFLVALMVMPTFQCSLGLLALGARVNDIHFGVINHDLVDWKTKCELQRNFQSVCDSTTISCGFLNTIQEDNLLLLNSYQNETIALEQVRLGKIWGYISIPANYSTNFFQLGMEKHLASNATLEGSRIRLQLDHSQYLTAFFIVKNLYINYLNTSTWLAEVCGIPKGETDPSFAFKTVYGDYSDNYVGFMLPGSLLVSLFALTTLLSALIFVSDHKQGTLSRARVAGLNIFHILVSHVIIQAVITLLQIAIVTTFQYFVLGIMIKGFRLQFIYTVISFLVGILSSLFGLLVGIVFRDEVEVFVFELFIFPIVLTWGGVCFPTETTTWFWQQMGYIIPIKLPIMALRSALLRGLGITHVLVWSGIAASLVWIIFFSIASIVAFKAIRL